MIKYEEHPNYEFYVINYDLNKRNVGMWNIFNNWVVSVEVFKQCKKHLRNRKKFTFEELQEEVRKIIMWQEWSRVEYEISVGKPFLDNVNELKKVDAYWQAEPNMKVITEMCIKRTKEFLRSVENEAN